METTTTLTVGTEVMHKEHKRKGRVVEDELGQCGEGQIRVLFERKPPSPAGTIFPEPTPMIIPADQVEPIV